MRFRTLPLLFALTLLAVPASAQQVSLTIQNGLVNLDAQSASIRQILDAWSRIGGTKIVNGERVSGGPVTLKLVNTPEREALEIILRSAAGYISVPRAANGVAGDSMFDRIMVLPTSNAPQNANASKSPSPATPPNPFFRGRQTDGDEILPTEPEPDADPAQPPVFTFPNQAQGGEQPQTNPFQPQQGGVNQAPFGQPAQGSPFQPVAQPAQQTPFGQVQPTNPAGQGQQPMVNPFAAAISAAQQQQQQQQQPLYPNVAPPAPGTFTIIGSPTPGVVQQPPAQPLQPGQRPPGQQ
jgi:hypothetical protein